MISDGSFCVLGYVLNNKSGVYKIDAGEEKEDYMEKKENTTRAYLLDASAIDDPKKFTSWQYFIPKERWEKTVRPLREEDRKTELAAWLLLYYALKKWGIPDEQINAERAYCYGKHGKPMRKDEKVWFNLSHSGNYILCVISDSEIGCDIEKIKSVKWKIAKRYFSEKEYHLLEKISRSEKNTENNERVEEALFTRFWVLRESYVKKTGEGLGTALEGLDFSERTVLKENGRGKKGAEFLKESFFEMEYNGYRIAICENQKAEPEVTVLAAENIIDFLCIRK